MATPVTDAAERRRLAGLLSERGHEQGPPRPVRPLMRRLRLDYDAELRRSGARGERIPVVAIRPAG